MGHSRGRHVVSRVLAALGLMAVLGLLGVGIAYVMGVRDDGARNHRVARTVGAAEKLDEVATQLTNFVEKVEVTPNPDPEDLADESGDLAEDIASVRSRLGPLDLPSEQRRRVEELLDRVEDLSGDRVAGQAVAGRLRPLVSELQVEAEELINSSDAPDVTAIASARQAAIELHREMDVARAALLVSPPPRGTRVDAAELDRRAAIYAARLATVRPILAEYSDEKDAEKDVFGWTFEPGLFATGAGSRVARDRLEWIDDTGDALDDVLHVVEELDDAAGDATGALANRERREANLVSVALAGALGVLAFVVGWAFLETRRRRESEEILHRMATRDELTGLLNRAQLASAFAAEPRTGESPLALMYVDVDEFKTVNDSYGHSMGDQLLVAVADRLSEAAGGTGKVFRLGGDELLVLRPVREADDASELSQVMLERASRPISNGHGELPVSVSIGWTVVTDPARSLDEALRDADRALYEAKASGRGRVMPERGRSADR